MNNLTMSADEQPDTYPQPEDGWVCFHCGERFKKVGAAEDHFGARPGDGLACRIKAGDERGLVMDLRKAQNQTRELQDKVDRGGCTLAGPKRGDCSHFIGLPGYAILGQHDGPDDTVDAYGKPNGWCWSCWRNYQLDTVCAHERRKALEEACKDVCMYCGKRALGYGEAQGPNSAANWEHALENGNGPAMLCRATSIKSRLRFEATSSEPGEDS